MDAHHTIRQIVTFTILTYASAVTIALALPHRDIASALTLLVPALAVTITIFSTLGRGRRREAWKSMGWRLPPLRAVIIALLLPAALAAASFGTAVAIGVARFSGTVTWDLVLNLVIGLAFGTVLILGEEIGWRGFLLPRLAILVPLKQAWLISGAAHALFHLPLLLLTTVYQSAGSRWIVVPAVMVTITLAGVPYGWMREVSGGIWAVAVLHNAFNAYFEQLTAAAITSSQATLAYVTTETGFATLAAVAIVAVCVLWWFEPKSTDSTMSAVNAMTRQSSDR